MPSTPSIEPALFSEPTIKACPFSELDIVRQCFGSIPNSEKMAKKRIEKQLKDRRVRGRLAHLLNNSQAVNWGLSKKTSSLQPSNSDPDEFSPQEQAVLQACNSPFGKVREGFYTVFGINR